MKIQPLEEEVAATNTQETSGEPQAAVKTSKAKAKAGSSEDVLTIHRKIDKVVEGKRKQKIYALTSANGVWFKLNQSNITVYDENTGKVRAIRYCVNEPSIFLDEQNKDSIREHIIFREGLIAVNVNRANLQDYLDAHPDNFKNGGSLFSEVNTDAKATASLDVEFLIHDAVGIVRDKSIEELLPVAIYLGVDIEQKNNEIKRELLLEAKNNPDAFIKLFDNPIVKARAVVVQAIDYNIIKVTRDSVSWSETNRPIVSVAAGQDAQDVITRFLLQDKGAAVYEDITAKLAMIS